MRMLKRESYNLRNMELWFWKRNFLVQTPVLSEFHKKDQSTLGLAGTSEVCEGNVSQAPLYGTALGFRTFFPPYKTFNAEGVCF